MTERPFNRDVGFIAKSIRSNPDYAVQYAKAAERRDREVAEGKIRKEISCDEARSEWLNMARRNYVDNIPCFRWPIDVEVGAHIALCETDPCQNLFQVYLGILRPSGPEDSPRIAEIVNSLERSMFGQSK